MAAGFQIQVDAEVALVSLDVGPRDLQSPLLADFTLAWNTYLRESDSDYGNAIAVDESGNVYVAGEIGSDSSMPWSGCSGNSDAFVAKFSGNGDSRWNTVLGGSGYDCATGIAVDQERNVYVTGESGASWGDSPLRAYTARRDTFVAGLDSDGALMWNTFLGGSSWDEGGDIAVDSGASVYVAGEDYTTWGSPVRAHSTCYTDSFAARLDNNGNLTWNTFLGGSDYDVSCAIALDDIGNVYLAGVSEGGWGSPVRPYTSGTDAYVAKLGPWFNRYFPVVTRNYTGPWIVIR